MLSAAFGPMVTVPVPTAMAPEPIKVGSPLLTWTEAAVWVPLNVTLKALVASEPAKKTGSELATQAVRSLVPAGSSFQSRFEAFQVPVGVNLAPSAEPLESQYLAAPWVQSPAPRAKASEATNSNLLVVCILAFGGGVLFV